MEQKFAQYIASKSGLARDEALARVRDGTYPRAPVKLNKTRKASGTKLAKHGKKPLSVAKRISKRLGPDDGRRGRGGSPTVQGGIPGLGKRR